MAETTFKTFLVAVFSWLMLISSANALNLKSNVIILLDLSNSYFTPDRMEDRIKDNIDQLSELIANKKDGPKRPSLIQVLPITGLSETEKPICEYLLHRRDILGKPPKCGSFNEAFCSDKPDYFKTYMTEECSRIIANSEAWNRTDITGALSLAGQLGQSQTRKRKNRYLIIFSDMFEYRDPEIPVSKVDLAGFDVLVICGATINAENDVLQLCRKTEEEWSPQLKKLGAESVEYIVETGRWSLTAGVELFEK